jgi:hypothetical protein
LGRKFGYTESDFLEAYFGKDNARDANTEFGEGTVFGFNESFKKKYNRSSKKVGSGSFRHSSFERRVKRPSVPKVPEQP